MQVVMNIADVRRVPGRGIALSGVNAAYDVLGQREIQDAVGEKVAVETVAGELREYAVLGVTTSSSLVGGKNLFILLAEEVEENELTIGARVLAARPR
jgi:hypothetical protein